MSATFRPLFLLLLICSISTALTTAQTTTLRFVAEPYLQNGTKSSMTILWETTKNATSVVEYGERVPLTETFSISGERSFHEVTLSGLKTGGNYFYRVVSTTASGERLESEVYTFRTTIEDNQPFAVMMLSDTQTNPVIWGKIATLGWKQRPNFVVHAGDLVGTGGNDSQWIDHFLRPGHILMSRFPMYSIPGNHEDDHANYYKYMANPDNPEYRYTFTYGNSRFFMLDSNKDLKEGSEQYIWLEQQLQKSNDTWKIVVHHHPVYTSDENDYGDTYKEPSTLGSMRMRDLHKLYDKYGVDMVFYGHIHDYERTWPIRDGRVDHKDGTRYIQIGGAGGGLEDYAPTRSWFSAKLHRDHHFVMMNIAGNHLEFQAIDQNGIVFDQFQIVK